MKPNKGVSVALLRGVPASLALSLLGSLEQESCQRSRPLDGRKSAPSFGCVCVCLCVFARRARERRRALGSEKTQRPTDLVLLQRKALNAHPQDPRLPGSLSAPLNMRLHPLGVAVGLFLSAFPLFYFLNNVAATQHPFVIASLGVLLLSSSSALIYLSYNSYQDPLLHVFLVLCFVAGADAVIALQEDGYTSDFADFYVREGEPYLSTAHGITISYWGAVMNYVMYLTMIALIVQRKSYRNVGLFWVGSLMMTFVVFLLGTVIGKYSSEIRPAFLLNVPYLFISIWAAKRFLAQPRTCCLPTADQIAEEQRKNLFQRPLDLGLVGFLLLAITYTLFRGLVVLDCPADSCFDYVYLQEPYLRDPVAYPKIQMLVYLFYGLPYFCLCIYGLLVPGCEWMGDWALVAAGAIGQAQVSHVVSSVHHRTPFPYRVPEREWWFVVFCNLAYGVVPQLLAYRCFRHPAFFCHPVSQDEDKKRQ